MGKVIRCKILITQAREKVKREVFLPLPRARELLPPDIVISTTPKDRATSEVL